jgi:hypothetical protein
MPDDPVLVTADVPLAGTSSRTGSSCTGRALPGCAETVGVAANRADVEDDDVVRAVSWDRVRTFVWGTTTVSGVACAFVPREFASVVVVVSTVRSTVSASAVVVAVRLGSSVVVRVVTVVRTGVGAAAVASASDAVARCGAERTRSVVGRVASWAVVRRRATVRSAGAVGSDESSACAPVSDAVASPVAAP